MLQEAVVAEVRRACAGRGRGIGEPLHDLPGQSEGLLGHLRAAVAVEDPGNQGHARRVERGLLIPCDRAFPRNEPSGELPQRSANLEAGVGRGSGQDGGAGQSHRMPLGRTAPLAGAAVRPEAAIGDAQSLDDGGHRKATGRPCAETARAAADVP